MKKTLGGDRLGAGKKQQVHLHGYERSNHDLSYIWRSTMAAGTLVPFLKELALPGDTFDIDLNADIKTHPTIGPLFGSYKVQLDVFMCPIRLYQGQLHNNKLGIGMNMSTVKLPQLTMVAKSPDWNKPDIDNQHVNPSCIFSYLGIRGIRKGKSTEGTVSQQFNAIPYIAYWDIYKNYYANKQEEIGAVIHTHPQAGYPTIGEIMLLDRDGVGSEIMETPYPGEVGISFQNHITVAYSGAKPKQGSISLNTNFGQFTLEQLFTDISDQLNKVTYSGYIGDPYLVIFNYLFTDNTTPITVTPTIETFPLENIDNMRELILSTPNGITITSGSEAPYSLPLEATDTYSKMYAQEGLAIKTYQSDLFNNWLSTEWIDGDNGINAITAIDTSDGKFTIDTLNLSKKVYDMLNRIAVSGGSYDDWLDAVYTHDRMRKAESPIYMGGLSKELVFQEVVSNAASDTAGAQPLGSLAGKGVMAKKHKGGKIVVKVDEPSYIIGIVSLTPRVDYSQGNKWDVELKTMDDLHKPALDQIGFQDLITSQMAWWDTSSDVEGYPIYKSAGKQPAWINYMTNVNEVRGNFAIKDNEMFMTLNRRYEHDQYGNIKDLTTYVDPVKFNHIFAQTSLDAQNFWTQISVDIHARRKMSAKIMPNL